MNQLDIVASNGTRWIYGLTAGLLAVLLSTVVVALGFALDVGSVATAVALALPFLAFVMVFLLSKRLRVSIDQSGIRIQGLFRMIDATWKEITCVGVSLFYPVLQVRTKDAAYRAFAARQTTFEAGYLEELNAELRRHGIETDLHRLYKWRRDRW